MSMGNYINKSLKLITLFVFICTTLSISITPFTTYTPSVSAACGDVTLLGFPAWYNGLTATVNSKCEIMSPSDPSVGGVGPFVWHVALNVINMGLVAVGYISAAFILYGGFCFIVYTGSSDTIAKARQTIFNAVIGLIISIASIAIVNLIANNIK